MRLAVLLASAALIARVASVGSPVVRAPCATVLGTLATDVDFPGVTDLAAFYSIPYAQPPVGGLRWMPPLPVSCGSQNVINATAHGNICVQMGLQPQCFTQRHQSEDCLTLDVYTRYPNINASVPVFVWIHGGGLVNGFSNSYHQLAAFAAEGDAVLVAVQYRLSAFGFLAHEALASGDPRGVSGNYGLLDIQLALEWVQQNIVAFGGDPRRVTIIGQSSGGTAILALLASPDTNGLITGAISLSGSPNITINLDGAYAQNAPVVQANTPCSGSADAIATCLRALNISEVAYMFPNSFSVGPALPSSINGQNFPGLPIIDGVTVVLPLLEALRTGLVDVPLIIETMEQESDTLSPDETVYKMNKTEYNAFLVQTMMAAGWTAEAGDLLFSMYQSELDQSTELAFQQWMTDISFLCGTTQLGIAAGIGFKSPVYLSVVARAPDHPLSQFAAPWQPKIRYAGHMWDYLLSTHAFEDFFRCQAATPYLPEPDEVAYGDLLMQQWQSLAHKGSIPASTGMLPVTSITDFPNQYNTVIQNGSAPAMFANFGASRCAALAAAPLFLDQRFWCCN